MAALTVTTSPNIAILDSEIIADTCQGDFLVNVQPTTYIGSGVMSVLGASVKIVNPSGVTVRDYTTSGYDIPNTDSPPMTSEASFAIPTQAGNYQYGTYQVSVRMTDEDGTEYTVTKSVKICVPDSLHKTRNYGSLSATMSGICRDGKVFIDVDTPPNYNGKMVESQVNDFELLYPTVSGVDPLDSDISSWSVQMYEGEYKLTGTICATYNYGDNVYAAVNYKVKKIKNIKCIIDECCVFGKLKELHAGLSSECTAARKDEISSTILETLSLLKTAQLAAECGEDASDYITDLEDLLGCQCTCNCLEGTPIINNSPVQDFVIEGCNVDSDTTGLTTTYTIDNYNYVVSVNSNGGVLTASDPQLSNCTKTTVLSFNIAPVYSQVRALANTDYLNWAVIINKAWTGLDATCLGYTTNEWAGLTFVQRSQILFNAFCTGGVCVAEIESDETNSSASDVVITWNNVTGVYAVDVYMDDVLKGSVLSSIEEYTILGAADGLPHSYSLIAKCSNGVVGNALDGSFTYYGCPAIAVPTVTLTSVADADCPYDISALVNALPSGIEAEWHNANNTNSSSLVADDTAVSDGTYYVFAKNSDNCYSLGVKVVIVCSEDTGCSAPQSLIVENITDGFRVRFITAAYPPPSNSYTVKRKLASNPDVDGSYTTIGTPTYNSTVNRWEILDETAVDNTLYTYKAISNCTASSPSILYEFANISCPTVTLTPSDDSVGYSFVPVGGSVDMYVVELYSADGVTRITYDTHVPSFSNPITGTLMYLEEGTDYKVRLKIYIGDYVETCTFQFVDTDPLPLVTGTLGQTAYTLGISLNDAADCNVTFTVTGTMSISGVPTAFTTTINILSGQTSGTSSAVCSGGDSITCTDYTTAPDLITYTGDCQTFEITITNPCGGA